MKTFDEIGMESGTDKASKSLVGQFAGNPGHDYLRRYEEVLGSVRFDRLRLMEFGVQYGYSLVVWEQCFPNAEIHGVDYTWPEPQAPYQRSILHDCNLDEPRPFREFITSLGDTQFDVIIDDGSHDSAQQRRLFENFFRFVRSGGYYVIEDLACGYEAFYGGNPEGTGPSIIQLLKELMDNLHGPPADRVIQGFQLWNGIVFLQKV